MSAPLIVVTGTGTEIGKTHVSRALLLAWRSALARAGVRDPRVAGLKPVETGMDSQGRAQDGAALEKLSTVSMAPLTAPYLLERPVSPHLAARDVGITIDRTVISAYVQQARDAELHGVLVELAGGLFSPLGEYLSNADVAADLAGDAVILVAPDRLGVLHDVAATARAALAMGLALSGVVLVAPSQADASTGENAAELSHVTDLPLLAVLPRATVEALATRSDLLGVVERLTPPARRSP